MIEFLNLINGSTAWLLSLNPALGYSIMGLLLAVLIGVAGFACARLRISPLWALALLVPYVNVIIIWILAYSRWRIHNTSNDQTSARSTSQS